MFILFNTVSGDENRMSAFVGISNSKVLKSPEAILGYTNIRCNRLGFFTYNPSYE